VVKTSGGKTKRSSFFVYVWFVDQYLNLKVEWSHDGEYRVNTRVEWNYDRE
jgi:hypothetical protein